MDTDSHSLRAEEDCTIDGETNETLSCNLIREIASKPQKRSSTVYEIETNIGLESVFGANDELSLKVNRDSECHLSECEPHCSKAAQRRETKPRDAKTRNLLRIITRLHLPVVGKLESQQSSDVNNDEKSILQRDKSAGCLNGSKKSDTLSLDQKNVVLTEIQNTSQLLEKSNAGEKLIENEIGEYSVNVNLSRSGPRYSPDEGTCEISISHLSTSKTGEIHQDLTRNNSMEIGLTTDMTDGETISNKQGITECATDDEQMKQCSYSLLKNNNSTIPLAEQTEQKKMDHSKDTKHTSRFGCKKRSSVSPSKSQLATHLPLETRCNLREQLRGKSFSLNSGLHQHQRILHNKKSQFVCNVCGKSFNHKGSLHRHKRTVHNKGIRFFCGVCEQSFTQKSNLSVHVRSVHNEERPFICGACGKSFTRNDNLSRHKRSVHNN